jgi:hypothetical protein
MWVNQNRDHEDMRTFKLHRLYTVQLDGAEVSLEARCGGETGHAFSDRFLQKLPLAALDMASSGLQIGGNATQGDESKGTCEPDPKFKFDSPCPQK